MGAPTTSGTSLTTEERAALIAVAEEAVRAGLEHRVPDPPPDVALRSATLRQPGASFVTLRRGSDLLGCIGTIEPVRPLVEDVALNASAAAFADPRLPAVTPTDFEVMSIKVSVLSPLTRLDVADRAELAAAVVPGVDGLLVAARRHRGTFLPSVWEQVPDRHDFLDLLWRKAGLPPHTWPDDLVVWRYRTLEFGTEGPRRPSSA